MGKSSQKLGLATLSTLLLSASILNVVATENLTSQGTSQLADAENISFISGWKANTVDDIRKEMERQFSEQNRDKGLYTIRWGDTLWAISQTTEISIEDLALVNDITNPDIIIEGWIIQVDPEIVQKMIENGEVLKRSAQTMDRSEQNRIMVKDRTQKSVANDLIGSSTQNNRVSSMDSLAIIENQPQRPGERPEVQPTPAPQAGEETPSVEDEPAQPGLPGATEEPSPSPAPTPTPVPEPQPSPAPQPTPTSEPSPAPDPAPSPSPAPQAGEETPSVEDEPAQPSLPGATEEPSPSLAPAPAPTPVPEPQPSPAPQPTPPTPPTPTPEPSPAPDPASSPNPAPQAGEETPSVEDEPAQPSLPGATEEPSPSPAPTPTPAPEPQPSPAPQPTPTPEPSPAPDPAPSPSPAPQPGEETPSVEDEPNQPDDTPEETEEPGIQPDKDHPDHSDQSVVYVEIPDQNLLKVINKNLGLDRDDNQPVTQDEIESLLELSTYLYTNGKAHFSSNLDGSDLVREEGNEGEKHILADQQQSLAGTEDYKFAVSYGIKSLEGLQYAKNLRKIKLNENEISSLEPLRHLTDLVYLELQRNRISDLDPLRQLKNLQFLKLYNNNITNVEPLKNLRQLKGLDLHYNVILEGDENNKVIRDGLSDISPLKDLTQLEFLDVSANVIEDLSPIQDMMLLNDLDASSNHIKVLTGTGSVLKQLMDKVNEGHGSVNYGGQTLDINQTLSVEEGKAILPNPYVFDTSFADELGLPENMLLLSIVPSMEGIEATYQVGADQIILTLSEDFLKNYKNQEISISLNLFGGVSMPLPSTLTNIRLDVPPIDSKEPLNMRAEDFEFYKNLFNKYNRFEGKYVNLTDEGNAQFNPFQAPVVDEIFADDFKYLKIFTVTDRDVDNELVAPLVHANQLEEFKVSLQDDQLKRQVTHFNFLKDKPNFKVFYYQNQANTKGDSLEEPIDIQALKEIPSLLDVRIDNTNLSDLSALADLNLTNLSLQQNKIQDIGDLKGLTSLKRLDLEKNQISDIRPLADMHQLITLYLYSNPISDISPLTELSHLEALHLRDTEIQHIRELKEKDNIHRLYIDKNQLDKGYIADVLTMDGLNTLFVPEIDLSEFNQLLAFLVRPAVDASFGEDQVRIFSFDDLNIQLTLDKNMAEDGNIRFENPVKTLDGKAIGVDDYALQQDPQAYAMSRLTFDGQEIILDLAEGNDAVIKQSYPIYFADYDTGYGQWGQPAEISGRINLEFILKDDVEEETYSLTLVGDDITSNLTDSTIKAGTPVEVTVKPKENTLVASFTANGVEKRDELVNNTYYFQISEDTEIQVSYQKAYQFKLNADPKYVQSSFATDGLYPANTSYVISVQPPQGQTIKAFLVNGKNRLGSVKANRYENSLGSHTTIEVIFGELSDEPTPAKYFKFEPETGTITEALYDIPKDVVIPSQINGVAVKHLGEYALYYLGLNSVVLPEGLETIGESALLGNELNEIMIPSTVKQIGTQALAHNKLTHIDVPETVQSIGRAAFAINQIEEFSLPSHLTEIPYKLFHNNKLEKVDIPQGIVSIGEEAFSNNQIHSLTLSESVKKIEIKAFFNNELKEVELPEHTLVHPLAFNPLVKTNREQIESLAVAKEEDYIFDEATGTILSYHGNDYYLTIPDTINGVKVTAIGHQVSKEWQFGRFQEVIRGAFEGKDLVKVKIPDSVTVISDHAFKGNYLKEIDLPAQLQSIGARAFEENFIEAVDIPVSVQSMGNAAFKNNQLTTVDLSRFTGNLGSEIFFGNRIKNIQWPKEIQSIPSRLFENNQLVDLVLPETVKEIGAFAFAGNQISNLTLPSQLELIDDGAFANLSVVDLTIPERVERIGKGAFGNSRIDHLKVLGPTQIEANAFYQNGLKTVEFGPDVTIGANAFQFNFLETVKLPDNLEKLGAYAFASNRLNTVAFNDQLKIIGQGALYVNNLKEVQLPESLEIIEEAAFYKNHLNHIEIPESVKEIHFGAFQINQLEDIKFLGAPEVIGHQSFKDNPLKEVHVPASTQIMDTAFDKEVEVIRN